jgi:hypothetical protein
MVAPDLLVGAERYIFVEFFGEAYTFSQLCNVSFERLPVDCGLVEDGARSPIFPSVGLSVRVRIRVEIEGARVAADRRYTYCLGDARRSVYLWLQ